MEGILTRLREADRLGFLLSCSRWPADSMSLISVAFWDKEGGSSPEISGINLPSVDSKLRNIYNFNTALISTEGDL
jgi:hypothetical protein